jgi:hypothetical protein
MEEVMAQTHEATLQRYAVRDRRAPEEVSALAPPALCYWGAARLAKNLLGGAIILAVWLALWTWLALGVVRPLSRAAAQASPASISQRA